MDDWFNDPFFNGANGSASSIQDHFAQVQRQMDNMMNNMMRGFGDFGMNDDMFARASLQDFSQNNQPRHSTHFMDDAPQVEEVSDANLGANRTKSTPIIEEPDDSSDDEPRPSKRAHHYNSQRSDANPTAQPRTYFYSSSMSSYTNANGVQHAQRKTYDSSTGKTEMAEMRRLGDQAVAKKREIDRDGHISDMMDSRNVDEADLQDFDLRWQSNFNEPRQALGHSGSNHHGHHHRALK